MMIILIGCLALGSLISCMQAEVVYVDITGLPMNFQTIPAQQLTPPSMALARPQRSLYDSSAMHRSLSRPPPKQRSLYGPHKRSLYGGWHATAHHPIGLGHISKDELVALWKAAKEVAAEPVPEPEPQSESEQEQEPAPKPVPASPPKPSPPPGVHLTISLPALVPIQLSTMFTTPAPEQAEPEEEPKPEPEHARIFKPHYPCYSLGLYDGGRKIVPFAPRTIKTTRARARTTKKSKSRYRSKTKLKTKTKSVQSKDRSRPRIIVIKAAPCHKHNHHRENKNDKDLIVEIPNGKLKGKDQDYYYSYESIPYAEPPVGDLRFEAPQPYQQKWPGIYDATVKPKLCIQWNYFVEGEHKLDGVEDCLTVNVYKPKTGTDKLPVFVYVHGGGFLYGAANGFGEDFLMKTGKIILVTLTYRLGALGFLSTEDDIITGNFGLKDQELALKWIKDNIQHFGGDPDKIVLMGFSSGGASTHLQMLKPTLKDKVKVVTSFSGSALNHWVIYKNARENAFKLAKYLKCPDIKDAHDIKNCLKHMSAADIVSTAKEYKTFGQMPFDYFGPVVEHKNARNPFITEQPIDIIKSGNYSHLPLLITYVPQDGCVNAAAFLNVDPKMGKQSIDELNEKWLDEPPNNLFVDRIKGYSKEYAKQLKEKYVGNRAFSEETYLKVQDMYTDLIYKDGILESLKKHSRTSRAPIYSYVYDNAPEINFGDYITNRTDIDFGTCHGDDFALILSLGIRTLRPDEQLISEKLIQMLQDFAETGELKYGDCKFVNNVGNTGKLKSLLITKNKCETITQNV